MTDELPTAALLFSRMNEVYSVEVVASYVHTSALLRLKKSFIEREISSGFRGTGLFVQNIAALAIC